MGTTTGRPRNPPTFGRSHSLRSAVPRPTTLGINPLSTRNGGDDISLSSSNHSSSSSILPAPTVTGNTPPTRDTVARRSRSSAPGAPLDTNTQVRRSLGSQFRGRDTTLAQLGTTRCRGTWRIISGGLEAYRKIEERNSSATEDFFANLTLECILIYMQYLFV